MMQSKDIQDFKNFIEKKNNLIKFDFKKYKNNRLLEFSLKKHIFTSKHTPLEIYKKFLQFKDLTNQLTFDEFLNYLQEQELWDSKKSIEMRLKFYLQKKYGYHKLLELLKKDLYNEEEIKNQLNDIPPDYWNSQIRDIIESLKKNNPNMEKQKLQKKIYNKLVYLGYRENEIQETIKENSIDEN
jgi:SOS response regulatory protein OraA/RecX